MVQLAEPVTSVVPLQLWAEPPEPEVRVTGLPASGLPKAVSVPERVSRLAVQWPWWPRCR